MNVSVNGSVRQLSILDVKTGREYTSDLIGNAKGFSWFDFGLCMPVMTQENYDWWLAYLDAERELYMRIAEVNSALTDTNSDKFMGELQEASSSDYAMMQALQSDVVDGWEMAVL